jgi:transcriptional regulator with XRE-family HTH domain
MTTSFVSTQTAGTFATLLLAVSVAPEEIGKRIQGARERKGWTQLQFALEAGVSPSSIQRWEAGKLPRVRELMRVADLLGIDAETLVEPEGASESDEETHARLDRIEQVLEELVARLERDAQGRSRRKAQ